MITNFLIGLLIYLIGVIFALIVWIIMEKVTGGNNQPDCIPWFSWFVVIGTIIIAIIGFGAELFNKIFEHYVKSKQDVH